MKEELFRELQARYPRLQAIAALPCEQDSYEVAQTPAGQVESLYLYERADFERVVIALAYRGEPRELPKSMGAMFLSGLVDRVKMEKTSIVLLSRGPYSGVPHTMVGMDEADWNEKSYSIRKYHELAHFVQRKLFAQNKHPLKDEVKADMVGLIKTFGFYDLKLASLFLGIEQEPCRADGRLWNYLEPGEDILQAARQTAAYAADLKAFADREAGKDAFEILIRREQAEAQQAQNAPLS